MLGTVSGVTLSNPQHTSKEVNTFISSAVSLALNFGFYPKHSQLMHRTWGFIETDHCRLNDLLFFLFPSLTVKGLKACEYSDLA